MPLAPVNVFVFGWNCIWSEFLGVCGRGLVLVATADLIISYPMHLSAVQHLTKIFNHYLGMEYKGGKRSLKVPSMDEIGNVKVVVSTIE